MTDLLIKGMEMPENCCECGVEWCERWKGLIIAGMSIAKARPSDCPLVEVPAPHGRLKDADAFDSIKYEIPTTLSQRYEQGFHDGVNYVQHLIIDAPTVIEAEE